ncbi:MAG: C1 family peptidase [Chitinophagales bacterium]
MKKVSAPSRRRISRFGWRPDMPDFRDKPFAASKKTVKALPKSVDLRKHLPEVYDQGQLGSCTGNAIAAALQFELRRQGMQYDFMPSRLFIYYNERVIEGTVDIDNGAEIRNGIKSVNKLGACTEKRWKYSAGKVQFKKKPTADCYNEALQHQVLSYHRVPRDLKQIKGCLAEGFPFVFGFSVYEKFEDEGVAKTGTLQMPAAGEKLEGGHAVLCVGYNDATGRLLVRNSWGKDWGQDGHFTMPYEYILNENLADDFWTIRMIEI